MSDSPADRLARAAEHLFMLGAEDSGSALCRANVVYGIAKLHAVQEQLGLTPDATFIGAPDATITRNPARWGQGFGYGGRIDYTGEFACLDIKPNACGMLTVALDERPDPKEIQTRIEALRHEPMVVDGVELEYDLANGNHFVDLLEVVGDDDARARFGPWAMILHGSGREMRGPSDRGLGMYWDVSEPLRRAAREVDTSFGVLRILEAETAREWWDFVAWVDRFHKNRRLAQADFMLGAGSYRVVNNDTHQGLTSPAAGTPPTTAVLGAHIFDSDPSAVYPITLRADLPAFLVRGKANLSDAALERLGFGERAERLGVLQRLRGANLLPHGGGYTYPGFSTDVVVEGTRDGERRFVLNGENGSVRFDSPRELPPGFRGLEVMARVQTLELAEVVAELQPFYVGET